METSTRTTRTTRNSRFQKGSGTYKCVECGKQTRDTGQDEAGVRMCAACYKAAGEYNSQDGDEGETK